MIVIISGTVASGKSTVVNAVSKEFGLRIVGAGEKIREIARKLGYSDKGESFIEFERYIMRHPEIDREVDRMVLSELEKGGCIVDSHLMAHYFKGKAYRIHLKVPDSVAAERLSRREGVPVEESLRLVRERNERDIKRYKELYGIDISSLDVYDLVLDTSYFSKEEMNEIILSILRKLLKTKKL